MVTDVVERWAAARWEDPMALDLTAASSLILLLLLSDAAATRKSAGSSAEARWAVERWDSVERWEAARWAVRTSTAVPMAATDQADTVEMNGANKSV